MFNRTVPISFVHELLANKDYLFLFAKADNATIDNRGQRLKSLLNPSKWCEIEYKCHRLNSEQKIIESFNVTFWDGKRRSFYSLRINDMLTFEEFLDKISNRLVVDFTLMNTRFLGSFFAILNMVSWEEVYFCYTEPGAYIKSEDNNGFSFKNVTMGFEQIPNLETISDSSENCDWIIFLGFEESRAMRLAEEASDSRRYTLPFISVPAMKPNWHNYAVTSNRQFFELKIKDRERIDYVSATDPFDTYQKLTQLKNETVSTRLSISPIGPKPVMLGCIMFVLENEDDMILFDNPFQESSNTIKFGESHFYDMTQFVKLIKNKRFQEEGMEHGFELCSGN